MLGFAPARAADLIWEVENPFRFYKHAASFEIQEAAFKAVGGEVGSALAADIVARIERHLNDPACRDASTPAACERTAARFAAFEERRLGWAARTLDDVCYDRARLPRRIIANCNREGRPPGENYILPTGHTVGIRLSPALQSEAGDGECVWTWHARAGGPQSGPVRLPCRQTLTIPQVPYVARDEAASGVAVDVALPDGRTFSEPDVVVKDLLVVSLGDSFASGEGNPDRPVTFSATREMIYDPSQYTCGHQVSMLKEESATPQQAAPPESGLRSDPFAGDDWHVLPRRRLDGDAGTAALPCETSMEFRTLYEKKAAGWLSADCHRSQYGYPFRVALELALEDRHRAVTLVPLACTGAETTTGLFQEREPRERSASSKVPAQFAELTRLLCERGTAAMHHVGYRLPSARWTDREVHEITTTTVTMEWCPQERRKRDIDLVLLSIGGNDIGFSALAAYTILDNLGEIGWIAAAFDNELRFGPERAEKHLKFLDQRLKAVKEALHDGFGVEPSRVIQTSYEPMQYDEHGNLCGGSGFEMNVHPKFRFDRERLRRTSKLVDELSRRLQCMSKWENGCPTLATGTGTGFTLVTEQQEEFARRGICARDPADRDGQMMAMPRKGPSGERFRPYSPAFFTPYAHHTRLFRTPNDAFLTANTHRESTGLVDILQPAFAGLYSGAFHPTAEAHAIIADHVMCYARAAVEARDPTECRGGVPATALK